MQEIYNENTWIKGYVPSVIDQINGYFQNWAVGWSDVLIIAPWVLYQQTGDASILTDNWDAFVHYMTTCTAMSAAPTSPPLLATRITATGFPSRAPALR